MRCHCLVHYQINTIYIVLFIFVHMATYLPIYQAYSRLCRTCNGLIRRNCLGHLFSCLSSIEEALADDTGCNQLSWDNEVIRSENEKSSKPKGPVINATKKKAKAVETNNHTGTLNLGVWWPKDQWNKAFPTKPCRKEELEPCAAANRKGMGVIRDKCHGEPPGTVTLNNQNTRSTVKTTNLGTSYSENGDAELDAAVAYINNASMPSGPTQKTSTEPDAVAVFKMAFNKNAKPQVQCSDFIGSINYQYVHLTHDLSNRVVCIFFCWGVWMGQWSPQATRIQKYNMHLQTLISLNSNVRHRNTQRHVITR
jgi:hypothetical protein